MRSRSLVGNNLQLGEAGLEVAADHLVHVTANTFSMAWTPVQYSQKGNIEK